MIAWINIALCLRKCGPNSIHMLCKTKSIHLYEYEFMLNLIVSICLGWDVQINKKICIISEFCLYISFWRHKYIKFPLLIYFSLFLFGEKKQLPPLTNQRERSLLIPPTPSSNPINLVSNPNHAGRRRWSRASSPIDPTWLLLLHPNDAASSVLTLSPLITPPSISILKQSISLLPLSWEHSLRRNRGTTPRDLRRGWTRCLL